MANIKSGDNVNICGFKGQIVEFDNGCYVGFYNDHDAVCKMIEDFCGLNKLAKQVPGYLCTSRTVSPEFSNLDTLENFIETLRLQIISKLIQNSEKFRKFYISRELIKFYDGEYSWSDFLIKDKFVEITSADSTSFRVTEDKKGLWYKWNYVDVFQTINSKYYDSETSSDDETTETQINVEPNKITGNVNRLQKENPRIKRGKIPTGSRVCGKANKVAVTSGHISYRVCTC